MTHSLSPSNPSRHNVSFVSIWASGPGESDSVISTTSKSSDETESEEPVDSFLPSIHVDNFFLSFLNLSCMQALMFPLLSLIFFSLYFFFFFFFFFLFLSFLWFIKPSSFVLSFVTVFNCITFLYMLFSLTELNVSLLPYPSMFLGILSARCSPRCSPVWLVKISFPVSYCYYFIYKVLLFLRDGQYRIMH